MKKLVEYRDTAKHYAIALFAVAVVLFVIYFMAVYGAQADYYETIADYSSLATRAASELASATSAASVFMYLGVVSTGFAGISFAMWMLANLLIAYKTPDDQEKSSD